MHDGSITFSTALDNAGLERELKSLEKKIEKKEREIADLRLKLSKASEKSVFDAATLDAEKAKLQEIKDRLADIRAMSKNKSVNYDTREGLKAQIPAVQEELADQRERVRGLQSEWNKLENQITSYDRKLEEATQAIEQQKEEAVELRRQLSVAGQSQNGEAHSPQTRLSAYLEKTSSLYQKLNGTMKQTTELSSVLRDMAAATTGKMSGMLQATGAALGSFSAKLSGAVAAAGPYIAVTLAVAAALKKLFDMMWKFGQEATSGVISYMKTIAELSVSAAQGFVELLKSIGKFSAAAIKAIAGVAKKAAGLDMFILLMGNYSAHETKLLL